MLIKRQLKLYALCVLALALLLKPALLFFANASADAQNASFMVICTSQGASSLRSAADLGTDSSKHANSDCLQHCLLTTGTDSAALTLPLLSPVKVAWFAKFLTSPHIVASHFDANATWILGLKHSPPSFT